MLNIIIFIAFIFAVYALNVANGITDHKLDIKDIIIVALCFICILQAYNHEAEMDNYTNELFAHTYEVGYSNGYDQAIKDAILWDGDEYTYTISFNGELHTYANYYHED